MQVDKACADLQRQEELAALKAMEKNYWNASLQSAKEASKYARLATQACYAIQKLQFNQDAPRPD